MSFYPWQPAADNVTRNDLSEWQSGQRAERFARRKEGVMRLLLGQSKLGLEPDQLVAVRDGRGVRVACLSGALWITQEHRPTDVILEAGQSAVIDSPGLTLVMALRASTLRVTEPRAAGLWNALLGWFRHALAGPTVAF
jgi:hypothetical protein